MRLTDLAITGLTADSRAVQPGFLFAALSGAKTDGRQFVAEAVARGAKAVLAMPGTQVPAGVELIEDANPRRRLAALAAEFHGAQPRFVTAVTGTNGKTSTVVFAQQIWTALGQTAASIGTLGVRAPHRENYGALTTPDAIALHAELSALAAAGVSHVAMEASSIGIEQHRLDGVHLRAAGFTNLSRDHLDYHGTMDSYLTAKIRLFAELLQPDGTAVLNADSPEFARLRHAADLRGITIMSYGRAGDRIRLLERRAVPQGQDIVLDIDGSRGEILLPLVGEFMAMNALCALGLVLAEPGVDAIRATEALRTLCGAPGRLQAVPGHPAGAQVFVDYAHTPDALQNTLMALRPHTAGRLICIFGCGGDRDAGKRPVMGRIAAEGADIAIVTDDNPRTEDAAEIRRQILAGGAAREIGDRRAAIAIAIHELRAGDTLVICGKGHESGQIIGTTVETFNDVDATRSAIAELERISRAV